MDILAADEHSTVLWVDTVGSFPVDAFARRSTPSQGRRLLVARTRTLDDLMRLLGTLHAGQMRMLTEHCRGLVIDSVAAPFRVLALSSVGERVSAIKAFGLLLRRLAMHYPAIVTNDLTSRFGRERRGADLSGERCGEEAATLTPSLGENWAAFCNLHLVTIATGIGAALPAPAMPYTLVVARDDARASPLELTLATLHRSPTRWPFAIAVLACISPPCLSPHMADTPL